MKSLGNLPINWFDVLLVILLVVGAFRGRKRGMSQEVIPLLKWITIVAVCGFFYAPLAVLIANATVFSLLAASYTAYLGLALGVAIVFAIINRQLGGKIVGSDTFGRGEYYLGIFSGMIRYACLLIFGLALLNARLFTQEEIDERTRFVQKNYDNDFFPALYQIQDQVFTASMSGPVIRQNLGVLLIKPSKAESKPIKRKELDLPM
jgi:uncharacterized membrane protein required for colicin V production